MGAPRRLRVTNADIADLLGKTASAVSTVAEALERRASAERHDQARVSDALEASARAVKACADTITDWCARQRPAPTGFGESH